MGKKNLLLVVIIVGLGKYTSAANYTCVFETHNADEKQKQTFLVSPPEIGYAMIHLGDFEAHISNSQEKAINLDLRPITSPPFPRAFASLPNTRVEKELIARLETDINVAAKLACKPE